LRGLAHDLKPLVVIGKAGVVDGALREIDNALRHHELVKVRLGGDRAERRVWAREIAAATGAELVVEIGAIVALYRPAEDPDERKITL
jgi:RNA-binding protein